MRSEPQNEEKSIEVDQARTEDFRRRNVQICAKIGKRLGVLEYLATIILIMNIPTKLWPPVLPHGKWNLYFAKDCIIILETGNYLGMFCAPQHFFFPHHKTFRHPPDYTFPDILLLMTLVLCTWPKSRRREFKAGYSETAAEFNAKNGAPSSARN